jgi:hypothetical protein
MTITRRFRILCALTHRQFTLPDKKLDRHKIDSSAACNEMLTHSCTPMRWWTLKRADDKYLAPPNGMWNLLRKLRCKREDERMVRSDTEQVFSFEMSYLENSLRAP